MAAWLACGRATAGYSARHDAISRLAALGAPTRVAMTAGFVVFGVGVMLYAWPLARAVSGWAWSSAGLCGLATLGVAAVPLGSVSDGLHGALAGIGYAALAGTPLLASPDLMRRGRTAAARASVATGVVCAACLVATTLGPNHGLFQRLGLTVGDLWIIVSATVLVTRAPVGPAHPQDGVALPPVS